LVQQKRTQPLDGLGYRPLAVAGTKEEFLQWIGAAVKEKAIEIPAEPDSARNCGDSGANFEGHQLQELRQNRLTSRSTASLSVPATGRVVGSAIRMP
jgi:hypothetical protein